MTLFCHIDVELPSAEASKERVALVFTPAAKLDAKLAADELKRLFSDAFVPRRTIFIGIEDAVEDLKGLLKSDNMLHVHLPFTPSDAQLYVFSKDGRIVQSDDLLTPMPSEEVLAIRRQGLTAIFERRGGVMRAGSSYHYVKPSGGHSRIFLRPGNIMKYGPEVAFIAVWLLPFIDKYTPVLYADTASVTQVAYAAVAIARRLKRIEVDPTINSFSSYDGVGDGERFSPEQDAVVLISASTSGNLRKRAIELGAQPDNVLTLFATVDASACLCDLRHDTDKNPSGILPYTTHSRTKCPDCEAGSLPIVITGDSFLPETPEPRLKLLKRTDKPAWFDRVMKVVATKQVIRCFKPVGEGQDSHLFFDLTSISPPHTESGFMTMPLSRVLSVDTDVVVHLPDDASRLLAESAVNSFNKKGGVAPTPIAASDRLDEELAILGKNDLSIVVIASVVAGGFSLLSISRALRNVAKSISYFVGLATPATKQAWEELQSNLQLRNDGHGRNPVESVWVAQLPSQSLGKSNSWSIEMRWLEKVETQLKSNCPLSLRLTLLRNLTGERASGLITNAFLPSPNGKCLELAENFAFYKTPAGIRLSQAEVYFAVVSILHALRDPAHVDGLRQSLNGPVLLAPSNFDRYNDSVLRAALLRAANPSELAYSNHAPSSHITGDMIVRMIERIESIDGEALPEFLLALVTGRMTLAEADLGRINSALKALSSVPSVLVPFISELAGLSGEARAMTP